MSNVMSSEDWEDFSMSELMFETFLDRLYNGKLGENDE